jgi:hypothetical protein
VKVKVMVKKRYMGRRSRRGKVKRSWPIRVKGYMSREGKIKSRNTKCRWSPCRRTALRQRSGHSTVYSKKVMVMKKRNVKGYENLETCSVDQRV